MRTTLTRAQYVEKRTARLQAAYVTGHGRTCRADPPCLWAGEGAAKPADVPDPAAERCVDADPRDGAPWHHRTTLAQTTRKTKRAGWVAAGMAAEDADDLFS